MFFIEMINPHVKNSSVKTRNGMFISEDLKNFTSFCLIAEK